MTENRQPKSETELLADLKKGQKSAADQLFGKYFERVIRAASRRINQRKLRGTGAEDIAVSVFESLWKKADRNELKEDELISSDEFWKLLCILVRNKTENHIRKEQAKKRGGGKVHGESVFLDDACEFNQGIAQNAVENISPFVLATFKDEHQNFMAALDDQVLQEILTRRLEGQSVAEIAKDFERSDRWVKRKLALIREIWSRRQQSG